MQDFLTKRFMVGVAILVGTLLLSFMLNEAVQGESSQNSNTGPGVLVPSVREGSHYSRSWSRSGWSSGK